MSLMTVLNFQGYGDKIANLYTLLKASAGTVAAGLVVNTLRNEVNNLLTLIVGLNDYEQETDVVASGNVNNLLTSMAAENLSVTLLRNLLNDLTNHMSLRGKEVNTSIVDVLSYLAYYNGGAGGNKFSGMVVKEFGDVWFNAFKSRIPYPSVMFESTNSLWNASLYANGLGTRAVGGGFVAGFSIDNTTYAEQNIIAQVTTNFSGGSGPPTLTIAATDDQGGNGTQWTGTFGSNNPQQALSGIGTISTTINGQARQVVTVTSTTGIVPGSILIVNNGLPDQETIVVEAVPSGTTFTAVFQKAHTSGATVTGSNSLTLSPSSGGRRCRNVTNITLGLTGHVAGAVQIAGFADRIGI